MEIKATPKELAELIAALQTRQDKVTITVNNDDLSVGSLANEILEKIHLYMGIKNYDAIMDYLQDSAKSKNPQCQV